MLTELISVLLVIIIIGGVFLLSGMIFVPRLMVLEPGQMAGALSNLWLWGTAIIAIGAFMCVEKVVIYLLKKFFASKKEEQKKEELR